MKSSGPLLVLRRQSAGVDEHAGVIRQVQFDCLA
jgi:hypothetical protein